MHTRVRYHRDACPQSSSQTLRLGELGLRQLHHVIGAGRAHAHVHTAGHTLGHARAYLSVEHSRCMGQSLSAHRHAYTNVQTHPCALRPPPVQPSTRHPHGHASPCTYAHCCARTRTVHASPSTCLKHAQTWIGTSKGSHENTLVHKQGYTQIRPHRRARTRVCTPRARARTEPPARTASRKALVSSPLPLRRRAGGGGMGVGGEDRAGRGSRGPTPPQARDCRILPLI